MDEGVDFLVGQTVEQIWVWGPFRLVFDSREPESYVNVEGPAQLTAGEQRADINFFVDGDVVEAASLLSLLWKQVVGAHIEGSILRLLFENGVTLSALPWDEGESWHVTGKGRTLTCLPGGDLLSH